jgi:hypothetical protein
LQWAGYFFKKILASEFSISNRGILKILNPSMQDIGLDFGAGEVNGDEKLKFYTTTVDIAKPASTVTNADGQSL